MASGKGSEYQGVWKQKDGWSAHIMVEGEKKYLGTYKIEEHAAIAYLLAKSEAKLK